MPGDDVEGRVGLRGTEEVVVEFADQVPGFAGPFVVVEGGYGCLEVACIGETVGSDGSEFGELVVPLVELADVAADRAVGEGDAVSIRVSSERCA